MKNRTKFWIEQLQAKQKYPQEKTHDSKTKTDSQRSNVRVENAFRTSRRTQTGRWETVPTNHLTINPSSFEIGDR